MLITRACTLAALFVLFTLIPSSQAHTVFAANLTGTLGDASFNGYTHSGIFFYNLTSTTLTNKTISSAKLVIGKPDATSTTDPITVVTLQGPFAPDSTSILQAEEGEETPDPPVYSRFDDLDITPSAVAAFTTNEGGIYDALQVACRGELYVLLETKNKIRIYAPLSYVPSVYAPAKTCEQSAVPYKAVAAAAPGSAPSSAAGAGTDFKLNVFTILFLLLSLIY